MITDKTKEMGGEETGKLERLALGELFLLRYAQPMASHPREPKAEDVVRKYDNCAVSKKGLAALTASMNEAVARQYARYNERRGRNKGIDPPEITLSVTRKKGMRPFGDISDSRGRVYATLSCLDGLYITRPPKPSNLDSL